ncbi:MAG: hypothetical protein JXA42_13375, partial [Anaerolineales bacterium]|nr:hypothetical protein [Anaerolineales bacterium]
RRGNFCPTHIPRRVPFSLMKNDCKSISSCLSLSINLGNFMHNRETCKPPCCPRPQDEHPLAGEQS